MPPRRNARGGRAFASKSATAVENRDNEFMFKSSPRGQGKGRAQRLLSPSTSSHFVAGAGGDSGEVPVDNKSCAELLPKRMLRSDSCIRVVVNESGDGPPLKKRRSEPVKLRQTTSPEEHMKFPGSAGNTLLYSQHPAAVETEEDACSISSNLSSFSISPSVKETSDIINEKTDPSIEFVLTCEEPSSGGRVKQIDDQKLGLKSDELMQSQNSQPSTRNEFPVLQAKDLSALSSSSSKGCVSSSLVSDYLETAFKMCKERAQYKPLDARITLERMTSRNLMDCLRIESEEDFKPDYDEDDKQDAAGTASERSIHSMKSGSCHSDCSISVASSLSTPFPASSAVCSQTLPVTVRENSSAFTPLSQPCVLAPNSKGSRKFGKAGYGFTKEETSKTLSRKDTKDLLDLAEICLPEMADCELPDSAEQSERVMMDDLNSLDDNQLLSRLSQHLLRSPVSISSPVPRRVVQATAGSRALSQVSATCSVGNKQASDLNECRGIVRIQPFPAGQKYYGPITTNLQVPCSSSTHSFPNAETVVKDTRDQDVENFIVDHSSTSDSISSDLSLKDGRHSSIEISCSSLSCTTSVSCCSVQSVAVQTDEERKSDFSSESNSDSHAHPLHFVQDNIVQRLELKSTSSLSKNPDEANIRSHFEDSSVKKGVCQLVEIPAASCPLFLVPSPTTMLPSKARASPRIPAATENKITLEKVEPEPILGSTQSLNADSLISRKICLKRPWKTANKKKSAVTCATNTSPAKVSSPKEKTVMLLATSCPGVDVFKGKIDTVSCSDALGMKQSSGMDADDVSQVSLVSPVSPEPASLWRQSAKLSDASEASEELLEGDGSSNEEDFFDAVTSSLPPNFGNTQRLPSVFSNQKSPATSNQPSATQPDKTLAGALLPLEGNQLKITVTEGERSLVSMPSPESSLDESSFATHVANWVSQKEAKTDSFLQNANIKEADLKLDVTKSMSGKTYTSETSMDLFEELTVEGYGSDFDYELEDWNDNLPTKDSVDEALLQTVASNDKSPSSGKAASPLEKCSSPFPESMPESMDPLVRSGWFPIPSRKSLADISAETSESLPQSECPRNRKVTSLFEARLTASQSSRFTPKAQKLATKMPNTALTNRFSGTKDWLNTKTLKHEATEDKVFHSITNYLERQDWKSLSQLFLISNQRKLYISYLAESLMSISDISISCCFKKLVMELEMSPPASGKPSFKKHVIGLVGIHIMERCKAFGNWSGAFEVLAEMLKKNIYFHLSFSQEHSAADIVDTAVHICMNVKKYDMVAFMLRQFDFFRGRLIRISDQQKLIKQKYCCLNVVLVAIVQALPVAEGQTDKNDKLALCSIGISILAQILKDWKDDVLKQPEVAELIELSCMFEILIQGCLVHKSSDGLILLSQLQECHPEYLEWKTSTLHMVISFFLKLGMLSVLLRDELPLNLIRLATERQLIPKLSEYIPFRNNVLVIWPSLSSLEMHLVILMYLKSILLKVHDLNLTSVPWSIQLVDRDAIIIDTKISYTEGMSSLQRLLSRDINPPLKWSKLSPTLLHIESCTVSVIRKILSDASIDLRPERSVCNQLGSSMLQLPCSVPLLETEPLGTGDVDLRRLPWNMQNSSAEKCMGFSSVSPVVSLRMEPLYNQNATNTSQLQECNETFRLPSPFPTLQNRFSGVRKLFEETGSNPTLVSRLPVRSSGAMITCENPNGIPAMEVSGLVSSVSTAPDIATKQPSFLAAGSPARKVLLKTPHSAGELPMLYQGTASFSTVGLKPNVAAGSFVQTPSSPSVHCLASHLGVIRDRWMHWDGKSSRKQEASSFQQQSTEAFSSNIRPNLHQQDLRQRLTNKKAPDLVGLPSNSGKPVKKLLDLDLLRPPAHLPFS